MDELTLHPDPAAPAAALRSLQGAARAARRVARGHADPRVGYSPIPASDPAITGSSPRIYCRHRELGTVFELERGCTEGTARLVTRYRREMADCWDIWAETRSRRMILPR